MREREREGEREGERKRVCVCQGDIQVLSLNYIYIYISQDDMTALQYAEERGHSEVVAMLKEHTASGGRK
jgi:hypothetical protein